MAEGLVKKPNEEFKVINFEHKDFNKKIHQIVQVEGLSKEIFIVRKTSLFEEINFQIRSTIFVGDVIFIGGEFIGNKVKLKKLKLEQIKEIEELFKSDIVI